MIHHGDCLEILPTLPAGSVNLIVTSPPYAERRKKQYGGIPADRYCDWMLPRTAEMMRVLADDGSLVLNIREHCENGERHEYVTVLQLCLRRQGWKFIEEYIWHKSNSVPGKYPNRLRNAWEHCFHLAKSVHPKMRQEQVKIPVGDWAAQRTFTAKNDAERRDTGTGSGFAAKRARWGKKTTVLPTNVLHFSCETHNQGHPAVFPEKLPNFFIRLFTDPGDLVLDPFLGSGTTAVAAVGLGRQWIGIEVLPEYCDTAQKRIDEATRQGVLEL